MFPSNLIESIVKLSHCHHHCHHCNPHSFKRIVTMGDIDHFQEFILKEESEDELDKSISSDSNEKEEKDEPKPEFE